MKNPLITVIMPVYNGEKYIEKSIGSVFGQDYSAIELIVVNDGSLDGSLSLLEQLQQHEPHNVHLQIIDQENQGICRSRNRAIHAAQGEYILFIDQDDSMKPDCVSQLYRALVEKRADMVIGGFELVDTEEKLLEIWTLNPEYKWDQYKITAPWGRIFKKEIINKNHIEFMETKISEDFYFNLLYMSYCQKIVVTSYRGYRWLYNEKSESHANMSQLSQDRNPLTMLTKLHQEMNMPNKLQKEYVEYMIVKHIVWYLFYVVKSASKEDIRQIYSECMVWLEQYYPKYWKNPLISFFRPKGERGRIRVIVKVAVILKRMGLLEKGLQCYARL